ncbi:hypothetical protein HN51_058678 [Arachis hypogaea]
MRAKWKKKRMRRLKRKRRKMRQRSNIKVTGVVVEAGMNCETILFMIACALVVKI